MVRMFERMDCGGQRERQRAFVLSGPARAGVHGGRGEWGTDLGYDVCVEELLYHLLELDVVLVFGDIRVREPLSGS